MLAWQIKSLALLPLYIFEGLRARRNQLRLPPAKGPVSGSIEGEGDTLRLLVIGDSSVAGVGMDHTSAGLTASLAADLSKRTKQPVEWRACGANSATSEDLRVNVLPYTPQETFSHIYISIGFNDLKNFRSASAFKRSFGGLLYGLRTKYPGANIYWSNIMSPKQVPALSKGLAYVLFFRRQIINKVGRTMCNERTATHLPVMPNIGPEHFCIDGVHASVEGNMRWAEHVGALIVQKEEIATKPLQSAAPEKVSG
ncbi:SGNH/GDSL hydrolase family protein [Polycladidibacter hongkongensis]|uniref:SGNH/GDSL hydrolase family protein n=1 Tax=Polycladidibacter hongkongensis TaxID=1647556 RepID=UPI0008360AE3|nr:SGNH/GDSL hydrolase family protein [Pseudovibrio hongkongensis]